jgi:D-sedoheptulose 7-phosphate isomerase
MSDYVSRYLSEVSNISKQIDQNKINSLIERIVKLKKDKGRLFFIGVGGSASNCSHAVNDFRKIAEIESYTPLDNMAELTARTNDEGWDTVFSSWLDRSNLSSKDLIFALSVGGGSIEKNVSVNIIKAIDYAILQNCDVVGIVGRDGGYVKSKSDHCIIIPTQSKDTITPLAESWQAVIWHLIVSDPRIIEYENKWESLDKVK